MHFFSLSSLFTDFVPVLVLFYLISFVVIYIGVKLESPYLTSLGISAALLPGLIGDYSYLIFITIAIVSILSSNLKMKLNWDGLLNFTIIAAFFVHLLWFVNNPLLGNPLEVQTDVPLNLLFILIYQIIFSLAFLNDKKTEENLLPSLSVLAITSIGYGLFLLITILSTPPLAQVYHLLASAIFLVFAVLFFKLKQSKVSTFFYAMTGYGALSIAIVLQFDKPDFFMWLCWLSFLVVSTAVWFRSKFIIVANFIIFLLIFTTFLIVSAATSWISLSFGLPVDCNPPCIPPGEGIGHYEAPRGEVFHYIRSDGGNRPVRHKVRAPSYMNVPTNRETVVGSTIADATLILAAVDPCYCCTERMAVALASPGGERLWGAQELIRMSQEKTWRLMEESGWRGPAPPEFLT